jgi:hypothetical protein
MKLIHRVEGDSLSKKRMILKHGKQGSMSNFQWTEGILAIGFMTTQNQ